MTSTSFAAQISNRDTSAFSGGPASGLVEEKQTYVVAISPTGDVYVVGIPRDEPQEHFINGYWDGEEGEASIGDELFHGDGFIVRTCPIGCAVKGATPSATIKMLEKRGQFYNEKASQICRAEEKDGLCEIYGYCFAVSKLATPFTKVQAENARARILQVINTPIATPMEFDKSPTYQKDGGPNSS